MSGDHNEVLDIASYRARQENILWKSSSIYVTLGKSMWSIKPLFVTRIAIPIHFRFLLNDWVTWSAQFRRKD